jgi:uncharacterized protein
MFSLRSRKLKPKDPSMDEILSSIRSMVENEEQNARSEPSLSVLEKSNSSDLSVREDDSAEIFDLTEALEEKATVVRETEGEELTMLQEGEDKKTIEEENLQSQETDSSIEINESPKTENILDAEQILDAVESEVDEKEALLSQETAKKSTEALKGLKNIAGENISAKVEKGSSGEVGSQTIDALTRELLRPMLKTWLDANLPSLVKWVVEEQIEKLMKAQLKESQSTQQMDVDVMALTEEETISSSDSEGTAA